MHQKDLEKQVKDTLQYCIDTLTKYQNQTLDDKLSGYRYLEDLLKFKLNPIKTKIDEAKWYFENSKEEAVKELKRILL